MVLKFFDSKRYVSLDVSVVAHRAMEDVKAMKRVFTTETLKPILSQLTIHHSSKILARWQQKRKEWIGAQQFVVHFGKDCSKTMALRLNERNITYQGLESMFDSCDSHESFDDLLKQAGINRKAWRGKIWQYFSTRK